MPGDAFITAVMDFKRNQSTHILLHIDLIIKHDGEQKNDVRVCDQNNLIRRLASKYDLMSIVKRISATHLKSDKILGFSVLFHKIQGC